MNPASILHIAGKDFRRFGFGLLAVWFLTALAAVLPFHPENSVVMTAMPLQDTVELLRWCGLAILSVVVVQDDGAESDRNAWLARPISGLDVLAAKALLLLAGLVLPCAIATVWAARALEAPSGLLWVAVASIGLLNLTVVAASSLLAALTRGLLRAAAVGLVGIVIYAFSQRNLNGLDAALAPKLSHGFGVWLDQRPPAPGQYFIQLAGFSLLACGILAFQYCSRRTRVAVVALVSGAVGVRAVALGYAYAGVHPWHPKASDQVSLGTISLISRQVRIDERERNPFPQSDQVRLGMQIACKENQWGVNLQAVQGRFRLVSGSELVMRQPQEVRYTNLNGDVPRPKPPQSDVVAFWFEPFGWKYTTSAPAGWNFAADLFEVTPKEYGRIQGARGDFDVWLELTKDRRVIDGELPLSPGSTLQEPGRRLRVRSICLLPNGTVNVSVDSQRVFTVPPFRGEEGVFVLINRERKEIAREQNLWGFGGVHSFTAVQGSTRTDSFRQAWSLTTQTKLEKNGLDADWLRDAHLVILQSEVSQTQRIQVDLGTVQMPTEALKD